MRCSIYLFVRSMTFLGHVQKIVLFFTTKCQFPPSVFFSLFLSMISPVFICFYLDPKYVDVVLNVSWQLGQGNGEALGQQNFPRAFFL